MKETIEVSRDYIEDALILTRDVANSLVGINDIDAKRYSDLSDTLDAMLNPTPQRRLKRLSEDEIKSIIEMYSCWALDGEVIYNEDIMEFTNAIMDKMMSNNE